MLSIIFSQNGATEKALKNAQSAFSESDGTESLTASSDGISTLSLPAMNGSRVLLIDGGLQIDRRGAEAMIKDASDAKNALTIFSTDGSSSDGGEISPDSLVRQFSPDQAWPVGAIAVDRSFLEASIKSSPNFANMSELIVQLIVSAATQGEEISRRETSAQLAASRSRLNKDALARRLDQLVNANNIEDLFPQHDWARHQEESGAACYHTLAAMFIRLGDTESASDCLQLSDRLEDSPRSLALKAIIALNRGEILGAVANMVSSLQQYELRKKASDKHYQTFVPRDLEIINKKLHAGLAALNVRNNEAALECFAEAVFNFDPFYGEIGVSLPKGVQ